MEKRQQGEASKATQALASKIRGLHTKLHNRLEELYSWMRGASEDEHANVRLDASEVDAMLRGEPAPWHAGSQSSGVRLLIGRRFHMAESDRQRCEEQLEVLPVEKRRLVQWLEIMLQRVRERVRVLLEAGVHVDEGPIPQAWHLTRQHGELFMLRLHARKLELMREEVEKKFNW